MLLDLIKKYKSKGKPVFWVLASIWLLSLLFAIIGYAVGTPWNEWLTGIFTKTHAITYFIVVAALGLGLAFLRNLILWYLSGILLLWLVAFWKVPAIVMPGLSSFAGAIILIFLFIVAYSNTSGDKE